MIDRATIEQLAAAVKLRLDAGEKTTYTLSTVSTNDLLTDWRAMHSIVDAFAVDGLMLDDDGDCAWCGSSWDDLENPANHMVGCLWRQARELLAPSAATEVAK